MGGAAAAATGPLCLVDALVEHDTLPMDMTPTQVGGTEMKRVLPARHGKALRSSSPKYCPIDTAEHSAAGEQPWWLIVVASW